MSLELLEKEVDNSSLLGIKNTWELTSKQKDLLESLKSFSAPYLEEKLLDEGKFKSKEKYQEAFTEFKKYVFLTQISTKPLGMSSKAVDEIWHQFILFTPQYHKFCDDFLREYLHHLPNTSHTPLAPNGIKNFVEFYPKTFGKIPAIWNTSSECETNCGDTPGVPDCDTGPVPVCGES